MIHHIFLIAKRDFRMYFASSIAYIVIGIFMLLIGWMFFNLLSYYAQSSQQFAMMSLGNKPTLAENIIRPLFGNMNVILLIMVPFITMRLLAEERRDHTAELLLTAPVHPIAIILGKFFSALWLVSVMIILTMVFPGILFMVSSPDLGVFIGCYLGLLLLVSCYIAIGLFWSSITEHQIVAYVLTFGTLLFFWLISWAAHSAGPVWSDVLNHLSLIGHYSNFSQGVIDTVDVIYYLSVITFGLFLTYISFDSDQWG